MKKYNMPWVSDKEEDPSIWGLIFGIFICSQTWSEFDAWMKEENEWEKCDANGKPLHPFKYRFSNFLKKHDWMYQYKCLQDFYYFKWENDVRHFMNDLAKEVGKQKDFNLMQKMLEFSRYIKSGSRTPRFFVKDGKEGDEERSDAWIENILVTLTSKLNYTREQALNAPLTQAIFDYLKYSEEQDAICFGSDYDDIEHDLEMNKHLRKPIGV